MASVRLDSRTEATLKQLVSQRGQARAEVIRDAIDLLACREKETPTAYDQLQPFIGSCDSGGLQLSEETGRKFGELVRDKYSARSAD